MDREASRKRCSFCGEQGSKDGRPLAGGLGAFICRSCAAYHHGVMSDDARRNENHETAPPWERMSNTELLGTIPLISQTAAQVDEFLVEWVELTRSRGISWAEIGKAMGVSRQAAWERFAHRVERLRDAVPKAGTGA